MNQIFIHSNRVDTTVPCDLIDNTIFQIWLTVDKSINETTWAKVNSVLWKNYANKWCYKYILITDENYGDYIPDKYRDFYENLRFTFNKIDFLKYLLVNEHSGVYIDLDYKPLDCDFFNLLNNKYIIGGWFDKIKNKQYVSNSVLGARKGELTELIEYAISEYQKKLDIPVYDTWKIRFMLQTTGVRMFMRWCKKNNIQRTETEKYMIDSEKRSWLKGLG